MPKRILTIQDVLADIEHDIAVYGTPFPTAQKAEQQSDRAEEGAQDRRQQTLRNKNIPAALSRTDRQAKSRNVFIPKEQWKVLCEVAHSFGVSMPQTRDTACRIKKVVRARCAVIYVAHHQLGLTKSEIADLLGLPLSTVKNALSRHSEVSDEPCVKRVSFSLEKI